MPSIRVCVRVRPLLERERNDGNDVVVRVSNEKEIEVTGDRRRWTFDRVFVDDTPQHSVFSYVQPSVASVVNGVNATIFAYGQTGSGKTYTMLGENEPESEGLVPRALTTLFDSLSKAESVDSYVVRASFLEIYNDRLYDLLGDAKRQRPLKLRECTTGDLREVFVNNLSEVRVSSANDVAKLLSQSSNNRAIRETTMNIHSSRSHMIMQVAVEVQYDARPHHEKDSKKQDKARRVTRGRLTLVDLAGSEKWDTSSTSSMCNAQTKELTHINSSLSALGVVINALSASSSDTDGVTRIRHRHVPYRNSKLTFFLRDALGGNSLTTVVATVSPSSSCLRESVSTFQFAERASRVKNQTHVNEVFDNSELLRRANIEIRRLRKLLRQRARPMTKIRKLRSQLLTLQRMNSSLREENSKLRTRLREGGSGGKRRRTVDTTVASRDKSNSALLDEAHDVDISENIADEDLLALMDSDLENVELRLCAHEFKSASSALVDIETEKRELEEKLKAMTLSLKSLPNLAPSPGTRDRKSTRLRARLPYSRTVA